MNMLVQWSKEMDTQDLHADVNESQSNLTRTEVEHEGNKVCFKSKKTSVTL